MKTTAAIEIEVLPKGNADTTVKNFKTQLREAKLEAQQMVITFGEFSIEALAAQKKVAELADKMEDFNDRVKALNPDKFAKVQTIVTGVASGFAAAQGAMALFGSESEDLQKTLVKVQGAMALASGLEGLGKIQQQFTTLAKDGIQALVQSFNTLKGALISTGIGALVVALGYAIANFDKLIPKTRTLADELNVTGEELKSLSETTAKQTTNVNLLINAVTDQNKTEKERTESLKKLKEQYPNYFNNLTNDINDTKTLTAQKDKLIETLIREARVRASQDQIEKIAAKNIGQRMKLNTDLLKAENDLAAIYKQSDEIAVKANTNTKDFVIPTEEEYNKLLKEQPEFLEKSNKSFAKKAQAQGNIAEIQTKINELNRQEVKDSEVFTKIIGNETAAIEKNGGASEVKTNNTVKNTKTEIKAVEDRNEAIRKLDEANATEGLDAITTQYANNLSRLKEAEAQEVKQKGLTEEQKNAIIEKYAVLRETNEIQRVKAVDDFTKANRDKFIAAELAATQKQFQDQINFVKIRDKNLKDQSATNQEIADLEIKSLESQLATKKKFGEDTTAIEQQILDKKRGIRDTDLAEEKAKADKEKEIQTAKFQAVNDSLGAIGEIYSAFASTNEEDQKKAFEVNKATSIAQAIVNTWEGVTAALANKTQLFPGQNLINAGLSLAAGLVAVKKISDTTYQSKSTSGSSPSQASGQGTMQSFAPRMSTLNTNDNLTQTQRVYVTEGDITRTQRRVSNNKAISVVE